MATVNPVPNGDHQCYYLSIDNFGVCAHDAETDKELLAVSYVGNPNKAIDTIKASLRDARLVGARFTA